MSATPSSKLLAFAIDAAVLAGQATLAHFQTALTIDIKSDDSPVTVADREAERIIRERIAKEFPDDCIFGEEFGESRSGASRRWIIDPIDGTRSFIRGVPLYGVMIALEVDGILDLGVLHFPALQETVAAARGAGCWWNGSRAAVSECARLDEALLLTTDRESIARAGSSDAFDRVANRVSIVRTWGDCYGYALVATGRAEAMFDPVVSPWDVAALIPIIEEAGGVITAPDGSSAWPCTSVIATNRALGADIRALLA